jgi:hypothetical protein
VPATVLIAAAQHLASLKEREELVDAIMFSDAEALKALDLITRLRPDIVLLDRLFAETSRGTALINRIKADPSLSGSEIRIVEDDRSYSQIAAQHRVVETVPLSTGGGSASVVVVEELPSPPAAALDQIGTRHAPRFKIADGVDVEIDGNPATLVNMSVSGAQVVSVTILKPNHQTADTPEGRSRLGGVRNSKGGRTVPRGDPTLQCGRRLNHAIHRSAQGVAQTPSQFATADPGFTIVSRRSEPVETTAHSTPLTSSSRSM